MPLIKDLLGGAGGGGSSQTTEAKRLAKRASSIEERTAVQLEKAAAYMDRFGRSTILSQPLLYKKFMESFVHKIEDQQKMWVNAQAKLLQLGAIKGHGGFAATKSPLFRPGGLYGKEFRRVSDLARDVKPFYDTLDNQLQAVGSFVSSSKTWNKELDLIRKRARGLNTVGAARNVAMLSQSSGSALAMAAVVGGGGVLGALLGGPAGAVAGAGLAHSIIRGRFGQHIRQFGRGITGLAGAGGRGGRIGLAGPMTGGGGGGLGGILSGVGLTTVLGSGALAATAAIGAGYEAYKLESQTLQERVRSLETVARGGRALGIPMLSGMAGMYGLAGTQHPGITTLAMSKHLQRLGIISADQFAGMASAYGMGPGFRGAASLATALGNYAPGTSFMSPEEWMGYISKISGMGLGGGKGAFNWVKEMTKAVQDGMKAGISGSQTFDEMNRSLDVMASSGFFMRNVGRYARIGATSGIPSFRMGVTQAGALGQASGLFGNILGRPLEMAMASASITQALGRPSLTSQADLDKWLKSLGLPSQKMSSTFWKQASKLKGSLAFVLPALAMAGMSPEFLTGPLQAQMFGKIFGDKKLGAFIGGTSSPSNIGKMMYMMAGLMAPGGGGPMADMFDITKKEDFDKLLDLLGVKDKKTREDIEELEKNRLAIGSKYNATVLPEELASVQQVTSAFNSLNDVLTDFTSKLIGILTGGTSSGISMGAPASAAAASAAMAGYIGPLPPVGIHFTSPTPYGTPSASTPPPKH